MSIHTILSQDTDHFRDAIKMVLSQYNDKIVHAPDCAYHTHKKNPHFFCTKGCGMWLSTFATRIMKEAQKEERERIKKELKGLDCGFCNYEEEVMERIDSRTKLQKMKGDK